MFILISSSPDFDRSMRVPHIFSEEMSDQIGGEMSIIRAKERIIHSLLALSIDSISLCRVVTNSISKAARSRHEYDISPSQSCLMLLDDRLSSATHRQLWLYFPARIKHNRS